jgi:nucleotide-binding universal stress UspA family protein
MNTQSKNILVPTDFSDTSLNAVKFALDLAEIMKADVFLLHVAEEQSFLSGLFSSDDFDKISSELWSKLNNVVDQLKDSFPNRIIPLLSKGDAHEKIVEVSELIGSTYVVMGTAGADNLRKRLVGSNALRVVKESRIPVISIKGNVSNGHVKSIALPLDLTKETREKVNKAIEMARTFHAKIDVFSILLTDDEEVVQKLRAQLNQVSNFIANAGVDCTANLHKGSEGVDKLGEAVIAFANEIKSDMIVIMTRQETNLTDFFIGSSAQQVIHESNLPVCSIIPSVKKDTTVFKPY